MSIYKTIIDGLTDLDFVPADDIRAREIAATLDYYAAQGWDAYRINAAGTVTFAKFGDDGCRLMKTSSVGVIDAEASFSFTESGVAMFIAAAAVSS